MVEVDTLKPPARAPTWEHSLVAVRKVGLEMLKSSLQQQTPPCQRQQLRATSKAPNRPLPKHHQVRMLPCHQVQCIAWIYLKGWAPRPATNCLPSFVLGLRQELTLLSSSRQQQTH